MRSCRYARRTRAKEPSRRCDLRARDRSSRPTCPAAWRCRSSDRSRCSPQHGSKAMDVRGAEDDVRMTRRRCARMDNRIYAPVLDRRVTVEGDMGMDTRGGPQAEQRQGGHAARDQGVLWRSTRERSVPGHRSAHRRYANAAHTQTHDACRDAAAGRSTKKGRSTASLRDELGNRVLRQMVRARRTERAHGGLTRWRSGDRWQQRAQHRAAMHKRQKAGERRGGRRRGR